jgi:hypothetical protein
MYPSPFSAQPWNTGLAPVKAKVTVGDDAGAMQMLNTTKQILEVGSRY